MAGPGKRGAGRRVIWRGRRRCPGCLSVLLTELREDRAPLEGLNGQHTAEVCEDLARLKWQAGMRWEAARRLWEWAA